MQTFIQFKEMKTKRNEPKSMDIDFVNTINVKTTTEAQRHVIGLIKGIYECNLNLTYVVNMRNKYAKVELQKSNRQRFDVKAIDRKRSGKARAVVVDYLGRVYFD